MTSSDSSADVLLATATVLPMLKENRFLSVLWDVNFVPESYKPDSCPKSYLRPHGPLAEKAVITIEEIAPSADLGKIFQILFPAVCKKYPACQGRIIVDTMTDAAQQRALQKMGFEEYNPKFAERSGIYKGIYTESPAPSSVSCAVVQPHTETTAAQQKSRPAITEAPFSLANFV